MKKEKKQFNNKKIWKWTITSLFLLFFGGSLIINITYLPKYYALKNRNDNALTVDISIYDTTSNATTKLIIYHYQTTMVTLGDLMEKYPKNYLLSHTGGIGRALKAVTYTDEQENNHTLWGDPNSNKGPYWMVYYQGSQTTGIDSFYLHMNDQIELRLEDKK